MDISKNLSIMCFAVKLVFKGSHAHTPNSSNNGPTDDAEEPANTYTDETKDCKSKTESAGSWPIYATTTFGNVRPSPNGETLLPPGMLNHLIQKSDSLLADQVMLAKDRLIRHSQLSDP